MNSPSTAAHAVAPLSDLPTSSQQARGLAAGLGVGVLAALFCLAGRGWYESLVRPKWAPPVTFLALLGIVVALLSGLAGAHLWAARAPQARSQVVRSWLWIQLALGLGWSAAFFGLHSAGWGYAVIMTWWCAVVALLWTGSRLSKMAFWLLLPLWMWVTFASSLNFAVLSFNVLRAESAEMDADPRNANSPADPPIIVKKR